MSIFSRKRILASLSMFAACALFSASAAHADLIGTVTVDGKTVIQAAGQPGVLSNRFRAGGLVPIHIVGYGNTSFTFSVTGGVTPNNSLYTTDGYPYPEEIDSLESISGINSDVDAFLTGVFVAEGGPTGTAPASIDFSSGGIGTAFSNLHPVLNQQFFIGDGLTGTGTGTSQTFYAPAGAYRLYLGISDGCNSVNPLGDSCYYDNSGSLTVSFVNVTPEPSSIALLGTGLLSVAGMARRKFRR